eukprot:1758247-Alexandrium_andersonii.AAC.1
MPRFPVLGMGNLEASKHTKGRVLNQQCALCAFPAKDCLNGCLKSPGRGMLPGLASRGGMNTTI